MVDTASAPFTMSNLGMTLGTVEIGVIVSIFLFGIVSMQTYCYYDTFPRDGRWLKTIVAVVWLLCLTDAMCACHGIYTMTIHEFGQLSNLPKFTHSLILTIVLSGCTAIVVQVFLTHRVLKLAGGTFLGTAIAVLCFSLSTVLAAFSILAAVAAFRAADITQWVTRWGWLIMTSLYLTAVVDVVITAAMCYLLAQRKIGAMQSTSKLLDKLIAWSLQTGLFTSVAAIVTVICFQAMESNYLWIAIFTFGSRLYANSFLSLLNARSRLRNVTEYNGDETGLRASRMPQPVPAISVSVETSQRFDCEASPSSAKSYIRFSAPEQSGSETYPASKPAVLGMPHLDMGRDSPSFDKS